MPPCPRQHSTTVDTSGSSVSYARFARRQGSHSGPWAICSTGHSPGSITARPETGELISLSSVVGARPAVWILSKCWRDIWVANGRPETDPTTGSLCQCLVGIESVAGNAILHFSVLWLNLFEACRGARGCQGESAFRAAPARVACIGLACAGGRPVGPWGLQAPDP